MKKNTAIILWTITIIVLSLLPKSTLQNEHMKLFKGADKIVHFTMYFILMFLWYWRSRKPARWSYLSIGIIFSVALGITLEFLQKYYIPGRTFDILDIVANVSGVLVVIIFIILKIF